MDAEGKITQYRYTAAGKLWQVEDALSNITEYGYDDRGNRTSVIDANGYMTTFEYDKMDRLVKEIIHWVRKPCSPTTPQATETPNWTPTAT